MDQIFNLWLMGAIIIKSKESRNSILYTLLIFISNLFNMYISQNTNATVYIVGMATAIFTIALSIKSSIGIIISRYCMYNTMITTTEYTDELYIYCAKIYSASCTYKFIFAFLFISIGINLIL